MPAFEDKIALYDRRRPLLEPVGLARDVENKEVKFPQLLSLLSEKVVRDLIESDEMPMPAAGDREGYFEDRHLEYWLSGYYDALRLMELSDPTADRTGITRCLDFGGCSGRVMRHIARVPTYEAWLCDINAIYIDWLDEYSTREIRAFQNRPYPTLPFEPNTFDFVCAFSVFSHIAEGEVHWLLELRRIIRPGGALYLTVLDDASWEYSRTQDWLIRSLARGTEDERLRHDIAGDIPVDRYILRYSTSDTYNCNVFYKRSFLERKWLPHFAAAKFIPHGHAYQTSLILRK
jgi:SAM-dependent methyltransferase